VSPDGPPPEDGAWSTASVKLWFTVPAELVAVIAIGYVLSAFAPGVPESVAVPLPLSTKVTPEGRVPVSENIGVGYPLASIVNELVLPITNTVLVVLMIDGAWLTVSVKLCVAFGLMPFEAMIVIGYVPPVLAAGVPERTPAELRVTPDGRLPVSEKVGVGYPLAVTANKHVISEIQFVDDALVIDGA